jgi:hypothetical protein
MNVNLEKVMLVFIEDEAGYIVDCFNLVSAEKTKSNHTLTLRKLGVKNSDGNKMPRSKFLDFLKKDIESVNKHIPSGITKAHILSVLNQAVNLNYANSQRTSPTEDQIKQLGFKLINHYNHDQYHTNRYKQGCLIVEFTYENQQLLTCDLTISELNNMPISANQLKEVSELLGNWMPND